jgi:hypothetical protein
MRSNPTGLRCKAERQGDIEFFERAHLAVEPCFGVGSQAVGPAEAGSQVPHAELPKPANRIVQPWVLEMEPLADAESRGVLAEMLRGRLGCPSSRSRPR